mgnify:CR=1 FL=1
MYNFRNFVLQNFPYLEDDFDALTDYELFSKMVGYVKSIDAYVKNKLDDELKKYIDERLPSITIFEGAATSDPIPLEPYTHSLKKAIEFFGKEEKGRFRFVTKFNDVDSLLDAKHNNHTEIRFSINTQRVIDSYEHHTASANKRIEAAFPNMRVKVNKEEPVLATIKYVKKKLEVKEKNNKIQENI